MLLVPFAHQIVVQPHRPVDPHGPAYEPAADKTRHAKQPKQPRHVPLLVCALLLLWWLPPAKAQAPCTHWAAPSAKGNGRSASSPMRVSRFWSEAEPGAVLCLRDGLYTETIVPPADLAGTEGHPITIRAEHDGKVLIDARHDGFAVWLSGTNGAQNHWFVIEGINAMNGAEAVYRVSGNNNVLRRVIGWNGTEGQNDSNIFRMTGQNNWCIDCAGWGWNSRKIMDMAQCGNCGGGGYLRGWAEWNDHPQGDSKPNNTWLVSYNTGNARFFNTIGTWNTMGEVANAEGVMEVARQCDGETNAEGTLVKGAITYVAPGATYQPSHVVTGFCASHFTLEDVAALVAPGHDNAAPFMFYKGSGAHTEGSVCKNCLGVHSGRASVNEGNSGWSMPGFREGNSLSAATGGQHLMKLQPANCKRLDQQGNLTTQGLWPWPMNQRIKEARAASGFSAVDVTADIERLLGPIPAECKSGDPIPGADTTPPTVNLTAPSNESLVSGTAVAVHAEAADNVGVVGITFTLNDEPVPPEQPGAIAHVVIDSTKTPNGLYRLGATARDAAGNVGVSNQATVLVYNGGPRPPEPPTGDHPPLACAGALGEGGKIAMRCVPEGAKR